MRAPENRRKSARRWASAAALSVFVVVFIAFAPAGTCVPKNSGGMDPVESWWECETRIGTHVSIPQTQTEIPAPRPSHRIALFWATFGALATAGVVYVARLGLTEFLLADGGANLEPGGRP